jgi:PhnB protein
MPKPVKPIPDGHRTVTPYLVVADADAILSFLERAFGGEVTMKTHTPDGRVAHAEIRIGDSMVMLGEGNDEWPPTRAMIHLYVEDVDAVFRNAVEAGARTVREPETMFYGDRSGGVEDAGGNQWWIATRVEEVSLEEIARRQEELAAKARSDG